MSVLLCHVCSKPAACIGCYEGGVDYAPACDSCCGHGNEDGRCWPIDVAINQLSERLRHLEAENERLDALLNTPEIQDFAKAVVLEAAHQRERWSPDDVAKSDADWFWLIGYLAGKALHTPVSKDLAKVGGVFEVAVRDKRLHRIITIAAAAANWHAQVTARAEAER